MRAPSLTPARAVLVAAAACLVVPLGVGAAAQSGAESSFMEAEGFVRLGDIEAARQRYAAIVDAYPRAQYPALVWRAAARVRLADLERRSGGVRAAATYVDVIEREPASMWTSKARFGLAEVVLASGDWAAAAELLGQIVAAADSSAADANADAAESARQRLALIGRFRLGGARDGAYWSSARELTLPGLELRRPVALGASPDGQVLIVDEGLPSVLLVNAELDRASRLTYNEHARPWWGYDGLPYLPTRRAGVIALGGSRLGFLGQDAGRPVPLKELQAGVRAPDGSWFLLDGDPARVMHFAADGAFLDTITAAGDEPIDVAVDDRGRLHVLDRDSGLVIRFRTDGQREKVLLRGAWRRPEAIEVDSLGNVYILDRDGRTLDVFDVDGNMLQRLGPILPSGRELRSPRDVSVDGEGIIFIADRGAETVWVVR